MPKPSQGNTMYRAVQSIIVTMVTMTVYGNLLNQWLSMTKIHVCWCSVQTKIVFLQFRKHFLVNSVQSRHLFKMYLAAQKLGTITPKFLCKQVNEVILPTLGLTKKNASICECTAINWLKKLGYERKDVKKGIYVDGHERPDVVEYREMFLVPMGEYQQWVQYL